VWNPPREIHIGRVSAAWLCQAKLIAGGVEPSQGST
jgi:hypothetical protein